MGLKKYSAFFKRFFACRTKTAFIAVRIERRARRLLNAVGIKSQEPKKFCPFCNDWLVFEEYNIGIYWRPRTKCPRCGSVDRFRYLYYLCRKYILDKADSIKVLHMAPEKHLYELLAGNARIDYTCIDLDPARYPYAEGCLKENALEMSFANGSFDFIISSMVIEHVPDAKAFIRESVRCLKKDGMMLLVFPVVPGVKSSEDPTVTDEKTRTKLYGQYDHVRVFGNDFAEYLHDESYVMTPIIMEQIVSRETIKTNALLPKTVYKDTYVMVTANSTP